MATTPFERVFEITNPEGIKLLEEMENSEPEEPISRHSYITEEDLEDDKLVQEWLASLKDKPGK